jgi:hypothetical protein
LLNQVGVKALSKIDTLVTPQTFCAGTVGSLPKKYDGKRRAETLDRVEH